MGPGHKSVATVEECLVDGERVTEDDIVDEIVEEYKRLNKKCDVVIGKIKIRKNKKKNKHSEE
jgi:hypothetical protein